jgi:hypothetical protein
VEQPVARIDVQNPEAILVEERRDAIEVRAVADENRVVPRGHEAVVVLVDHIDPITQIQKRLNDLPRLPPVRMIVGNRLSFLEKEGHISVADEHAADGLPIWLTAVDSSLEAAHFLRNGPHEVQNIAEEDPERVVLQTPQQLTHRS